MGEEPAILVTDLHEVFRIYKERPPSLKERLYRFRRAEYTEFHALNGISVRIEQGETVGLIGHNGSGKSTLLKCMARILPADQGRVETNGRIATLLELGAGFQQDLSGRENIYLNGSILGLSRKQIDAAFDAIVDFAGIRDFLDIAIRNYSSGMYVRLGFAIAVHVDPDILLVDEVLSVGDVTFQERSLARMRSFKERGKTVVLVSHDLGAVRSLCDRVIVLDHGRIAFDGEVEQAVAFYHRLMHTSAGVGPAAPGHADPDGDGRARIGELRFDVAGHDLAEPVPSGAKAKLVVEVSTVDDLIGCGSLAVGIALRRPDLQAAVYETRTSWQAQYVAPPPVAASLWVTFAFELNVLTGTYLVDVLLGNAETDEVHDRRLGALEIVVHGAHYEMGIAPLAAQMSIDNPHGVWPSGLAAEPDGQ
jgi:ABC-type polysaccharide/polyol phosphate transport system ATPase subunit